MSTLTINKSYTAGAALTEAMIDAFRTGLLTLINTTKLSSENFSASMSLTSAKFNDTVLIDNDNVFIDYGTGNDAKLGIDSNKDLVFDTTLSTTEICFYAGSTYYLEFFTDKVYAPGDIILAKGGANRTIFQALSSYRKPVLQWAGASDISISNNTASSDETVLFFPKYFLAVDEVLGTSARYRQAQITSTANGYATNHTGNVRGGRRVGVSLTSNSWYTVYAVGLRSGTQYNANSLKFILVFDTILPTAGNESTLNGHYGEYNWVYMGLIRYGYGATGDSSSIIKFIQARNGWCWFYGTDGGSTRGGLTMAQSTAATDDTTTPLYTFSQGMSGQVLPSIVSHMCVSLSRTGVSDWYIKNTSDKVVWRFGWQTDNSSFTHGHLIELPYQNYTVHQERKSTSALDKRVCVAGFCDGYMALRRQGHGI